MARISLESVTVDFPVYSTASRSLKARLAPSRRLQAGPGNRVMVRALDDLTLDFNDGDRVGLIGANGAGKSTLLSVIAGIYEPPIGIVRTQGRLATLLDMNLGLDPESTGRDALILRAMLLGFSRVQALAAMPAILDFADLDDFIDLPLRTYSTGMRLRLAFAVSTAIEPEILLLDEIIGAGDKKFAERARERLQQIVAQTSIMIVASHNLGVVEELCNKVVWLEQGRIRDIGSAARVLAAYRGE